MNTTKDLAISILSNASREQTNLMFSQIMREKLESALEAKKAAVATKLYTKQEA